MMHGTADLATILNPPKGFRLQYGQGRVIAWEAKTGHNTIEWAGAPIHDVSVLSDINALTIRANDVVGMLGWASPEGVSSWWVLGRIVDPGAGATDLVIYGNLIVGDGASFAALYPSGLRGATFGPLRFESTGEPSGHGLLIQEDGGDQPDIFLATQDVAGETQVIIGMGGASPVDIFQSWAMNTQIHNYGDTMLLQSHDDGDIEILSDERLWLYGNDHVDIDCINGDVDIYAGGRAGIAGASGTFLLRQDGGSVTANVHMTTDGQILRVGSTERIKRDITDFEADPATVLRLRPRSWLPGPVERQCPDWVHERHEDDAECHAGEAIDPPEGARRQVGFIAEELDELGLGDFVEYDGDGLPASISYDRLTAALVPVLQAQQAQIEALTARLDALEQPEEGS